MKKVLVLIKEKDATYLEQCDDLFREFGCTFAIIPDDSEIVTIDTVE